MKSKFYVIILFLTGVLLNSCDKNDIDFENEYEASHKRWQAFKKATNNSYKYVVKDGSWIGVSWETTISVSNGTVIQRHFKYTFIAENNQVEEDLEWVENENEINSKEYTAAAEALTLDQVYEKAKSDWLKRREGTEVFFETKNKGLISTCGYVINGCMDDCFNGIKISHIEALK